MAVFHLTDLATLKTRLGTKHNKSDGALRQLLRTISGHLIQKVNRAGAMEFATRTELIDVDAERTRFRLKAAPIASAGAVTSVIFSPTQDWASGSVIDASSYIVDLSANALVLLFHVLPPYSNTQPQSLQVIYDAGLADLAALRASDKFAPLEEAAVLLIQQVLKRRRTMAGKMNTSGQGGSVNLEALSQAPLVKALWQPIRRSNIGG